MGSGSAFTAGDVGSIRGQGTKIPQTVQFNQTKNTRPKKNPVKYYHSKIKDTNKT